MTRSRNHAAPRELHLVTFLLDQWEYGVEVADVCGIYHGLAIIPTPDEPDIFAGEVQLHHQHIPVVNLRRLLNLQTHNADPGWLLITESHGQTLAILVDQVMEVIRTRPQSLITIDARHEHVPAHEHLTAAVAYKNRTIYLPDLPRMLAECHS